ncbi:MAG: ABC transporter substrate-binding protein [Rhodobacterales bacterium]|nr:MAG: ABC transporter substrate-binding protein [Rhodobacterales bacterium]
MKKIAISTAIAALFGASAALADCGDIKMAEFNWPSGELMAHVDKFIMEEGYGCNIELVVGGTTAIFASMNEKGEPQVAGEEWVNSLRDLLDPALEEGRLHAVNKAPIMGLGEGWWIPEHTANAHPEWKTVLDIIEHPEAFPDSEDPSKGALVGCPAGWGCQANNAGLFQAFDMEAKGWKLVDPGSAAGLDGSIAKASERGENWFGYYWAPTAIVGKYKLKLVPFGVEFAGMDNWTNCIATGGECDNVQKTSWVKSEVYTIVTDEFMKNGGEINDYLAKRVFSAEAMGAMLVYMTDEQADGADAAIEFLLNYEDLWTTWVPADVAAKVKAAL